MLAELFRELQKTVIAAHAPQVFQGPNEPTHKYRIYANGEVTEHEADYPPVKVRLDTLDSLVRYVKAFLIDAVATTEIYVSEREIVVLLSTDDPRQRATLPLRVSPLVTQLRQWGQPNWQTQDEALRWLRVNFRPINISPNTFYPSLSALTFRKTEEGAATIDRGRTSLGKQLTAEMRGVDPLPETVILYFPFFADVIDGEDVDTSVSCVVELDPQKERVAIVPVPNGMADVADRVLNKIVQKLQEAFGGNELVRVYRGAP